MLLGVANQLSAALAQTGRTAELHRRRLLNLISSALGHKIITRRNAYMMTALVLLASTIISAQPSAGMAQLSSGLKSLPALKSVGGLCLGNITTQVLRQNLLEQISNLSDHIASRLGLGPLLPALYSSLQNEPSIAVDLTETGPMLPLDLHTDQRTFRSDNLVTMGPIRTGSLTLGASAARSDQRSNSSVGSRVGRPPLPLQHDETSANKLVPTFKRGHHEASAPSVTSNASRGHLVCLDGCPRPAKRRASHHTESSALRELPNQMRLALPVGTESKPIYQEPDAGSGVQSSDSEKNRIYFKETHLGGGYLLARLARTASGLFTGRARST